MLSHVKTLKPSPPKGGLPATAHALMFCSCPKSVGLFYLEVSNTDISPKMLLLLPWCREQALKLLTCQGQYSPVVTHAGSGTGQAGRSLDCHLLLCDFRKRIRLSVPWLPPLRSTLYILALNFVLTRESDSGQSCL